MKTSLLQIMPSNIRPIVTANLVTILLASSQAGLAAEASGESPDSHELWLISCREITTIAAATRSFPKKLKAWRFDATSQKWQSVPQADYQAATGVVKPTCFWIHGDRVEEDHAFEIGKTVYEEMVVKADSVAPVRFVIWSWPSAQEIHGRPVKDARIKAERTNSASYCLGWTLNEVHPETPVSLVGFSFGANVLSGAVDVIAGGDVCGYGIKLNNSRCASRYQVVLMAAAMDCNALRPGGEHGQAMNRISELLLLNNYQDWVLRRYHRLNKGSGSQALGYAGLSLNGGLADRQESVRQINAGEYIGKQHGWANYVFTDELMNEARRYAVDRLPHVARLGPAEGEPSGVISTADASVTSRPVTETP